MLRVLTWPFRMVWSLVGVIFLGIGKLFSMILGLILAAAGVALSCTIIGAIVGIPAHRAGRHDVLPLPVLVREGPKGFARCSVCRPGAAARGKR